MDILSTKQHGDKKNILIILEDIHVRWGALFLFKGKLYSIKQKFTKQ